MHQCISDGYLTSINLGGCTESTREKVQSRSKSAMINNFWSFNCIIRRFRKKAEECSIKVEEKSEYGTSSECSFYYSKGTREYRGLFYCGKCNMAINADVARALNIAGNDGAIIPSSTQG